MANPGAQSPKRSLDLPYKGERDDSQRSYSYTAKPIMIGFPLSATRGSRHSGRPSHAVIE